MALVDLIYAQTSFIRYGKNQGQVNSKICSPHKVTGSIPASTKEIIASYMSPMIFSPLGIRLSYTTALLCAVTNANAQLIPVNFGSFITGATYSVASELGFFAANNLNVTFLQVPNSTFAYSNLLAGGYDILNGQIDNDVNLVFNSGENFTVLGQTDAGSDLVLAAIPSIKSVTDLQGKAVMVDSPLSGYTYVLRKILSLYGLTLENGNYTLQTVGGTPFRYANLLNGSLAGNSSVAAFATLLTYPFTAMGTSLATPVNILARISDFVQPYSSRELAVASSSLANPAKKDAITRFMTAYYQASLFLQDASNKPCVLNALVSSLNISMDLAELEYAAATNPLTGETAANLGNFTISPQGLLNIVDLRSQFGGFPTLKNGTDLVTALIPGPGKFIDYSVIQTVVSAVGPTQKVVTCQNGKAANETSSTSSGSPSPSTSSSAGSTSSPAASTSGAKKTLYSGLENLYAGAAAMFIITALF